LKKFIYFSFCLLFAAKIDCSERKESRRPAPLAPVDGYEPSSDDGVIRSPRRWVNFPSSTSSDYSSDDSSDSEVPLRKYRKSRDRQVVVFTRDNNFFRAFNNFMVGTALLAIALYGLSIAENGASKSLK
jgi:hypothetical protein